MKRESQDSIEHAKLMDVVGYTFIQTLRTHWAKPAVREVIENGQEALHDDNVRK